MKVVFNKIVTICLLLAPILQTYGWGKYDFAFIILTVLLIPYLLLYGYNNKLPRVLALYFVFWFITHFIHAGDIKSLVSLGWGRTVLIFLMFYSCIDRKTLLKYYKIICLVCISFLFIQEFSYYATGVRIIGIMTSLPLALNVQNAAEYYDYITYFGRSSSFFSEPAIFCQYTLPLFCIELFDRKRVLHFLYATIIAIAILLSQSGNGLVGLSAIAVAYCIIEMFDKDISVERRLIVIVVFVSISISSAYFFFETNAGKEMLERRSEIENFKGNDRGAHMSGFIRVFRGYYVYNHFSVSEKILGEDNTDKIKQHIVDSNMHLFFDEDELYFNTIQEFLLRTGAIGLIFYILFLIGAAKNSDKCGKALLLTLFVLSFISSMFFTPMMAIFLLFARKDETLQTQTVDPQ